MIGSMEYSSVSVSPIARPSQDRRRRQTVMYIER